MNNYTINMPNYTIGEQAISCLGEICKALGNSAVIIGGKMALAQTEERITDTLENAGIASIQTIWYGGECTPANIEKINEQLEDCENTVIIGVGGGRALDTAKAVADAKGLPIVTVPTIAATCAAATKLSVVYDEEGVFDQFYFYELPPSHVVIDTAVIAKAPAKYLRAGMGDTLAKHYECTFASSGKALDHNSGLARAMSSMCVTPLLEHGQRAMASAQAGEVSFALDQVVLANVITTGLVSMLIAEEYNGAIAHSLFYGLTQLPHIEEYYLHGDVVGYGVLVQLLLDGREEEVRKLYGFFKKVGMPTCLGAIEVPAEEDILMPILENVLTQPDMEVLPYTVTEEMLLKAIWDLEKIEKIG
ncbi:MAG: iron-containing alcohol dehydrogenase family protein [Cellulosilyticaceae bacterium]